MRTVKRNSRKEYWRENQKNVLAREILYCTVYTSAGEKARRMFWQEKFYTRVLARKPEQCSGKRNSIQEYWRESQKNVLAREKIQEYWREIQKNVLARDILYKSTGEKTRRMFWQEKYHDVRVISTGNWKFQ